MNKKYWIVVPIILLLLLLLCPMQCSNETDNAENKATLKENEISNTDKNIVNEDLQNKEEIQTIPSKKANFSKHTISKGESLSSIAKAKYGKASLWPLIYEANKDIISNPNRISAGKEIKIPELEKEAEKSNEIDKEELGNAYFDVYLKYKELNKEDSADYLWVAMQLLGEQNFNQLSANVDLKDLKVAQKMRGSPKI